MIGRHPHNVARTVNPGQRISPHVYRSGQDNWTVIAGFGEDQLDASGATVRIAAGGVAVAPAGAVHAFFDTGPLDLVSVSAVSPALPGFWAL